MLVSTGRGLPFEHASDQFTYARMQPVTTTSVYEIPSVTKVASTLQAIMFLKDQGKLNLEAKLSAYLPELKGTNKQNLVIRDILAHQAGLQPGLPFWQRTTQSDKVRNS